MDGQLPVFLYSIGRFSSFTLSSAPSAPHREAKRHVETSIYTPQRHAQPSLALLHLKESLTIIFNNEGPSIDSVSSI
jgi:hypothetical protein